MRTTLLNLVLVLLSVKGDSTSDDISKYSGIIDKELKPLLDNLEKEGKIKKEEDFYSLK